MLLSLKNKLCKNTVNIDYTVGFRRHNQEKWVHKTVSEAKIWLQGLHMEKPFGPIILRVKHSLKLILPSSKFNRTA